MSNENEDKFNELRNEIKGKGIISAEQAVIKNLKKKGLIKPDAPIQRCEYELLVEKYFGIKLQSSTDKYFTNTHCLVDFALSVHQHFTSLTLRQPLQSFLDTLIENHQIQIAGYYNVDKTDEERKIRNAVIQEYSDLIALYKSQTPPAPAGEQGEKDGTIIQFLQGSHSFDGVWFGEKHPKYEGSFWWRKFLPPLPSEQQTDVITFKKQDWDNFKLRMGDRNYQGLINIEDFATIIGELEDKSRC